MNRGSEHRLYPGTLRQAQRLAGTAGACRYTWNWARDRQRDMWREYKEGKRKEPPSFTYFSLGKEFTQLRRSPGHEWMLDYPHREVKYTLKAFEGAMREAVQGKRGFPKRKYAEDRNDSFTIPTAPKLRDGRLWIPGVRGKDAGFWVAISRRGGDPYAEHGEARSVTIRRRPCGRWYASINWQLPDAELPDGEQAIGVDMNVGQVTASDGARFDGPDLAKLERKRRKYQRREDRRQRVPLLDRDTGEVRRKKNGDIIYTNSKRRERARRQRARIDGRLAYARRHYCHTTSAKLARKASTVVLEDLQVNMTKSARGTREQPGRNVRAKRGLNRSILGTGWAALRAMLEYKVRRVVRVPPHHTSQQCCRCGFTAAGNRTTQAAFKCLHCGHQVNADVNAAINILRRGLSMLRGDTPRTDMEGGTDGAGLLAQSSYPSL